MGAAALWLVERLKALEQVREVIWWSLMPQKQSIGSQVALGSGMLMPRVLRELCKLFTHVCSLSGRKGCNSEDKDEDGTGEDATWSAVRA